MVRHFFKKYILEPNSFLLKVTVSVSRSQYLVIDSLAPALWLWNGMNWNEMKNVQYFSEQTQTHCVFARSVNDYYCYVCYDYYYMITLWIGMLSWVSVGSYSPSSLKWDPPIILLLSLLKRWFGSVWFDFGFKCKFNIGILVEGMLNMWRNLSLFEIETGCCWLLAGALSVFGRNNDGGFFSTTERSEVKSKRKNEQAGPQY